jgi:DNA repair protein RadC
MESARQRLIDLTHSARESGNGVSVIRMWKSGNVDYKRIPELRGVDLERYRGKGREEVRVPDRALGRGYLRMTLAGRDYEVFMVLFLDAQNRILEAEEMFRGTLTQTSV